MSTDMPRDTPVDTPVGGTSLERVRGWWREHPLPGDSLMAVVMLGLTLGSLTVMERTLEAFDSEVPATWVSVAWSVVLCASLVLRRVWPAAGIVVATASFAIYRWVEVPEFTFTAVVYFVAFVSVGVHLAPPWRGRLRAGAIVVMTVVYVRSLLTVDAPDEIEHLLTASLAFDIVFNVAFFSAAWILGDTMRLRIEREQHLVERAQLLELEREERARRAVADERYRIARELHDVVAHHVSVMGVQAGAARRVVDRDRDAAVEALTVIERSSRQAVDELYRLLGFLRRGDEAPEPVAPQPSLRRIAELVDDAERSGVTVRHRVEGDLDGLPHSVDVSAFRIVQEALTNVRKHARATLAEVTVRCDPDAVEIVVADDGVGAAASIGGNGSGHGLIGMRERVSLHGGRLSAGPRPGGGYRVRARIPVVAP